MFNPVLITTPRTGSSLVCQLLGDIARHTSDYKNDLQEFYTIEPGYEAVYEEATVFNEKIIVVKSYKEVEPKPLWYGNASNIDPMMRARSDMLVGNQHRYMIKLFAGMVGINHVRAAIFPRYEPVYLERRNLMQQFLSWMYLSNPKAQFHYQQGQTAPVKQIYFNYRLFNQFKNNLLTYEAIKKKYPGPVIFYEDVMQLGGNCQAVAALLNISCEGVKSSVVKTVNTPYTVPIEQMLLRNWKWDMYKNEVEDFFNNYRSTT